MSSSSDNPLNEAKLITEWVWYDDSDAIAQGIAVYYNSDYGTATVADQQRFNRVLRPANDPIAITNMYFAGVTVRGYSAKPSGQLIEVALPGSRGAMIQLMPTQPSVINTMAYRPFGLSASHEGKWIQSSSIYGHGAAWVTQTASAGSLVMCNLWVGNVPWGPGA